MKKKYLYNEFIIKENNNNNNIVKINYLVDESFICSKKYPSKIHNKIRMTYKI